MTTPFEAMAYYKTSPQLAGHAKITMLDEELGWNDERKTLGAWHYVISWVARYLADSGNLSRYPSKIIAREFGWDGDPDFLLKALVKCGLCDEITPNGYLSESHVSAQSGPIFQTCVVIHDWPEWHGDLIESRGNASAQSTGGKWGAHLRWHEESNPSCGYCIGTHIGPTKDTHMRRVEQSKEENSKEPVVVEEEADV